MGKVVSAADRESVRPTRRGGRGANPTDSGRQGGYPEIINQLRFSASFARPSVAISDGIQNQTFTAHAQGGF